MPLQSINPANGELITTYEEFSSQRLSDVAAAAQAAFQSWRHTQVLDRAALLLRASRALRLSRDSYATLMAREMGKPVKQAGTEVDKCIICCEYFADFGEGFMSRENIATEAEKSYVILEPLGVVLAVMPWNFPFWQVFRAAVPALMAGNVVILKHSSNVSGCALACEEVFRSAGFPEGVFQTVLVGGNRVEELVRDPHVRAVTFTGSTSAGAQVASLAGLHLKKTVLELGGSDPYIVLEDADIAQAATLCATSRLINAGQSCIAAKRFIVLDKVREEFEVRFTEVMRQQKFGDPLLPATTIGPLARINLRDELHHQVLTSILAGARLLCGGEIPEGPGAFYPPTVLADVTPGMPAHDEETFGPVAAIIRARNEAEAVQFANDSAFGLGGGVFTRDRDRGERIASQIEAGFVCVNDFVRSDPRLPFGGIKKSGYGRELSSFGLREFMNVKTVWVK